MIDIQHLIFAYPDSPFQLKIDALSVSEGEKLAIVGPSGTGKTTLLNLLSGILVAQSGSINVSGQALGSLGDSQRRDFRISNIGMVFQQFELLDYLTVQDNIRLPFMINRTLGPSSKNQPRAQDLLQSVGLDHFANRYPSQLSRGEQQRVAICRALITKPKLILADEPTGNLDPANKSKILQLLFSQVEAEGQTLIVVTHDHSILDRFDRVIDFETFLFESNANAGEAVS